MGTGRLLERDCRSHADASAGQTKDAPYCMSEMNRGERIEQAQSAHGSFLGNIAPLVRYATAVPPWIGQDQDSSDPAIPASMLRQDAFGIDWRYAWFGLSACIQ